MKNIEIRLEKERLVSYTMIHIYKDEDPTSRVVQGIIGSIFFIWLEWYTYNGLGGKTVISKIVEDCEVSLGHSEEDIW